MENVRMRELTNSTNITGDTWAAITESEIFLSRNLVVTEFP